MNRPEWQEDLENDQLPRDIEAFKKAPAEFAAGERIGWWYTEDAEFAKENPEDEDLANYPPYSGVVIPGNDIEARSNSYEPEDCIIVMDRYPVEKCYCETSWIAFRRLLDNPELVSVIKMKKETDETC